MSIKMEAVQKCTSCRGYKAKQEFLKNCRPIKTCLRCRARANTYKPNQQKVSDTDQLRGLILNLESKIEKLMIKPHEQTLEEFVKNDCCDAVLFTDFIESMNVSQLRSASDLIKLIRESYLAIPQNRRPFYSRDNELWVNLPWKNCDIKQDDNILIALGEVLVGNRNIKIDREFVNDLVAFTKI